MFYYFVNASVSDNHVVIKCGNSLFIFTFNVSVVYHAPPAVTQKHCQPVARLTVDCLDQTFTGNLITACRTHAFHVLETRSAKYKKSLDNSRLFLKNLMRKMGLEPTRPNGHKILSLACLPIPALPHDNLTDCKRYNIRYKNLCQRFFIKNFKVKLSKL